MPVIREYGDQRVSAPGPIQRQAVSGDQLGGSEGRAIGQLGEAVSGAADVVAKRLDQENTSDITAKMAKAHADLAIKLQDTIRTAQPGDKTVFEKYNQEVSDTLSKIGEGATTEHAREFYTKHSAAVSAQLSETAAAGQAELAGVKAVQDYTTTLNSLSTATLADPTSVTMQRAVHDEALKNLVATGQLPQGQALKLKTKGDQELSSAAVKGWINLNPEYAKEKLKSGMFDTTLDADHKQALYGEADQAIRAKDIEAERRKKVAKELLEKQQTATQNTFLQQMSDGQLDSKMVLNSNLEAFGSGSKEQFLQLLAKKNSSEEKLKTDPGTMIDLYQRIHLPDGDPKKLVDENDLNQYFGNGLSFHDLNNLREEIQGSKTEAGKAEAELRKQIVDIAKGKLTRSNPLTGLRDPVGDTQMQKWMVQFYDDYRAGRSKGIPTKDMYDPKSKDYLGNSINNFTRTNQQIMKDLVPKRASQDNSLANAAQPPAAGAPGAPAPAAVYKAPSTAPLPRLPNESPQDYLKRKKAAQ